MTKTGATTPEDLRLNNAYLKCEQCLGDRVMACVSWSLFGLALCLAPVHQTWGLAVLVGLLLAGSLQVLVLTHRGARLTRVWSAVVFMAFAALLIQQMHGMIEMHFSIFVLLAFLLFYNDWLPLVVGAGVIAVHHLVFHLLQHAGFPVWVFPTMCSIRMVFVHAAFVVFETGLLVSMAVQQERAKLETGEVMTMLDAMLADHQVDLRVRTHIESGSAGKFGRFVAFLRELVQGIVGNAERIATSGDGITASAAAVAQASSEQKQQIEHAVVAMHEMQSAIAEISRNSQQMAANMGQLRDGAQSGGQVVSATIAAIEDAAQTVRESALMMEELERASQSIGQIVATINEIAEQTNLLALNASIEAARAGESGRGFAVVAGEVRRLAERTSKATHEIDGMITSIQGKTVETIQTMRSGKEKFSRTVETAQEAGAAMREILETAEQQSQMVEQIAGASTEQKAVTDRVSEIMQKIVSMAEQSSAGAAESAEASAGLQALAVELHRMLGQFQTDGAREETPAHIGRSGATSRMGSAVPQFC